MILIVIVLVNKFESANSGLTIVVYMALVETKTGTPVPSASLDWKTHSAAGKSGEKVQPLQGPAAASMGLGEHRH